MAKKAQAQGNNGEETVVITGDATANAGTPAETVNDGTPAEGTKIPDAPAAVEAEKPAVVEVQKSGPKLVKIMALEDHKCVIAGEEIVLKKDRNYEISEIAAQVLTRARIIIKR